MERFGDWVRKNRVYLGKTQDEMAAALGYRSRQAIAQIESGATTIPAKKIKKFSAVFGASEKKILDMIDTERKNRLKARAKIA